MEWKLFISIYFINIIEYINIMPLYTIIVYDIIYNKIYGMKFTIYSSPEQKKNLSIYTYIYIYILFDNCVCCCIELFVDNLPKKDLQIVQFTSCTFYDAPPYHRNVIAPNLQKLHLHIFRCVLYSQTSSPLLPLSAPLLTIPALKLY